MFYFYANMLMFSGLLLLVVGAAVPGQTTGSRVVNLLFGVGFLGYGVYLRFIFGGGHYIVFWYALVFPFLLVFRTLRGRRPARRQPAPRSGAQAGPPAYWGSPQPPADVPPAADGGTPVQHHHPAPGHHHPAPPHTTPPTHH